MAQRPAAVDRALAALALRETSSKSETFPTNISNRKSVGKIDNQRNPHCPHPDVIIDDKSTETDILEHYLRRRRLQNSINVHPGDVRRPASLEETTVSPRDREDSVDPPYGQRALVDVGLRFATSYEEQVSSEMVLTLHSLCRGCSTCVKINAAYTEWFDIHKGVKQGCLAPPLLLNLFTNSILIFHGFIQIGTMTDSINRNRKRNGEQYRESRTGGIEIENKTKAEIESGTEITMKNATGSGIRSSSEIKIDSGTEIKSGA
ncbi:hypothetical protein EVAR_59086_1 [Eumeta japonica]|uniref:Reverse transcriptase domain-containing protein n=1 Tax=Eumeta variegata TaxID=151549 RepID=A0A4C1Z1I6_EUMVA|nr:hypothetical protein EVAR_59086_1 [Eumeta japonica]